MENLECIDGHCFPDVTYCLVLRFINIMSIREDYVLIVLPMANADLIPKLAMVTLRAHYEPLDSD